ncbi:MAG: thioredoxin family protein [Myxococcaceae bacterium]
MTAIVRSEDFENEVLRSTRPVLVDFHAADCLPCALLAPVIEQLEVDFERRAHVVIVDIGALPSLAERYDVQQVPCLVFFRNGKEIGRLVGAATRGTLSTLLDVVGAELD